MLPGNRVEITADSLAGLMRQVPVRMAVLYSLEFERVNLASGSVIRQVRIVDADPEPYERVEEQYTGEVDDDLPELHQITTRVAVAQVAEWNKEEESCQF